MIQVPETTLPRLLFQNAERFGDKVALREKDFGIWQTVTWRQFAAHVRSFGMGLYALGVRRGDVVAIIGDNRPEWLYAEFAAQSIGAMSIGVYQDSVAEEIYYTVSAANARVIVVEDQEQVDKVIDIWPRLADVLKVIYYEPRGMRSYRQPYLDTFPNIEELGRSFDSAHPGLFEAELAAGAPDDVAILSTTSGTTGKPKLAMLTHRNLLNQGASLLAVDPLEPGDEFVSFLPLAWVGEQMVTVAAGMQCGLTINFPESSSTVQENIREIGPRVMFSPPRIWENMLAQVQVKMQDATWLKRAIFEWAMKQGYARADTRFNGGQPGLGLRLRYGLARLLAFEMLKDHLGLRFLKRAYTGGAALGPDVFRFYHAIGVNLKQVYGQTESAGLSVIHRDGQIRFQTVGTPLPNTLVRIAHNGEILIKSPSVFVGYYKNPEATAEALEDGWLHSGDAGYFDEDGHLIVIDRAKDVMTLADGTTFSPQFIENKLKFSPYIKEAVVFGGDWPFVTAIINIDFANVGKWAEQSHISYTTYTDLAQKPQVYALIRKDVERANADLPPAARIRRFLLLHKEFDADDGELTRTRKVRRRLVAQRYREIVDVLYSDQREIAIETTITYQDGRTALIKTRLRIEDMVDHAPLSPVTPACAVTR